MNKQKLFEIVSLLAIFLLVITCCILHHRCKLFKDLELQLKKDFLRKENITSDIIHNTLCINMAKNAFELSNTIDSLLYILEEGILYLRITDSICSECLISEVNLLNDYLDSSIRDNKLSIISNTQNKSLLHDLHEQGFEILKSPLVIPELDKVKVPYYLLNYEGRVVVNFVVKEIPQSSIVFFNLVFSKIGC